MDAERQQILEAVTEYRRVIEERLAGLVADVADLGRGVSSLADASQSHGQSIRHNAGLTETSLLNAHQQIASLESAKAVTERRFDELEARLALLETIANAGGMAVESLQSRLESLETGLQASIRDSVEQAAVKAVEAYVEARKRKKPPIPAPPPVASNPPDAPPDSGTGA